MWHWLNIQRYGLSLVVWLAEFMNLEPCHVLGGGVYYLDKLWYLLPSQWHLNELNLCLWTSISVCSNIDGLCFSLSRACKICDYRFKGSDIKCLFSCQNRLCECDISTNEPHALCNRCNTCGHYGLFECFQCLTSLHSDSWERHVKWHVWMSISCIRAPEKTYFVLGGCWITCKAAEIKPV